MTYVVILTLYLFLSSCQDGPNVLKKGEQALSKEQEVTLYLENKEYDKAINAVLSLTDPESSAIALRDSSTPIEIAQALIEGLKDIPNSSEWLSVYAVALLGHNGINILQLSFTLIREKSNNPEDMINNLVKIIPTKSENMDAIDTVLYIYSSINMQEKTTPSLINEVLVSLVAVAARIISLDQDGNGAVSAEEIQSIQASTADSMFSLLTSAKDILQSVIEREENADYAKVLSKMNDVIKKISEQEGEDNSVKIQAYLMYLLKKSGKSEASISTIKEAQNIVTVVKKIDSIQDLPYIKLDPRIEIVFRKANLYRSLIKKDADGWIREEKCDGLLFNSLASASGLDIPIHLARDINGQWFRHHKKDCFKNGESGSTISRDMLMGLLIHAYFRQDSTHLSALIEFGKEHTDEYGNWIMGEGDEDRIKVSENLQTLIRDLTDRINQNKRPPRQDRSWFHQDGYRSHLEILRMLLVVAIRPGVHKSEISYLKSLTNKNPKNALYLWLYHGVSDGDISSVVDILLDESLFPEDRLPSTADRCTFYLWQREQFEDGKPSQDWTPCKEKDEVFSGIDYLFISYLLRLPSIDKIPLASRKFYKQ